MSLPLKLLHNLRITFRQKAGLTSVFLLAMIIIVVAIVRASQIGGRLRTDLVLLTVWSLIESTICTSFFLVENPILTISSSTAVIVGCLPTFKALFSRNAFSHARSGATHSSSYNRNRFSGSIPLHSSEFASGTHTKIKAKGLNERWPSSDSTEGIASLSEECEGFHLPPLRDGEVRVQKDVVSHDYSSGAARTLY